jgi:hypothetical protein
MKVTCRNYAIAAILALIMAVASGCAGNGTTDPYTALNNGSLTGDSHLKAIEEISKTPEDPKVKETLEHVMWRPGYSMAVRESALNELATIDLAMTKRSIRQHLPKQTNWAWLSRVCEIITERNWKDLSPALVSSWAQPILGRENEMERPEYKAIAQLFGTDHVIDTVFDLFVESRSVADQGLRTRCWELLHRLGQRQRLIDLLASTETSKDDLMLADLREGARELGIVPFTREEILWLRKLREPSRADFWDRAVTVVKSLPEDRRKELELRDLPILVSASLYDSELLQMSVDQLYAMVDDAVRDQKHYVQESNFEGFADNSRQRLYEYKGKLTWGDLAAMLIAIRATHVPEVVSHLFNYAMRDKVDKSTEYGGVIALDAKDRFEIKEFPPVSRQHDNEFISSQAMLDAAYTSIFHFHMHVQNFRNERYAGPGFGDVNYADSTRANCLVFTFVGEDALNVDFYRHGRVVVDLGVITKP